MGPAGIPAGGVTGCGAACGCNFPRPESAVRVGAAFSTIRIGSRSAESVAIEPRGTALLGPLTETDGRVLVAAGRAAALVPPGG